MIVDREYMVMVREVHKLQLKKTSKLSSSKTIAKNTMFLYFRMILVMGVSLFTSRIVLRELGVSDYGIYSLVGGVVAMFGFFNAAMSSATQRYLAFDIGRGDNARLQKTFSATLTIHFGIALLVLVLADANIYIITVPTPVDKHNSPDLTPLIKASETVGKVLKKGDIVVYESTVYPGATEEECIPVLERVSGLSFNKDFFAGYSPERINPGDKEHTVDKILKVTSGSTPQIGEQVDQLYKSVITAGTHLAPTIKVAEAAKVIENAQRDINIAFVNELAKIFNILEIDTQDVLEAAGTKWNFLNFTPGLVGGHCIGIDPYYLAQKAQEVGYHPEIILAGRRMNDSMAGHVASQVVKTMIRKGINVNNSHVLMLGITFKENTPDVRNTKIVEVIRALEEYGVNVCVYDPWANPEEVMHEHGIRPLNNIEELKNNHGTTPTDYASRITDHRYDAVVLGVAHKEFLDMDLTPLKKEVSVVYDVKGVLKGDVDAKL